MYSYAPPSIVPKRNINQLLLSRYLYKIHVRSAHAIPHTILNWPNTRLLRLIRRPVVIRQNIVSTISPINAPMINRLASLKNPHPSANFSSCSASFSVSIFGNAFTSLFWIRFVRAFSRNLDVFCSSSVICSIRPFFLFNSRTAIPEPRPSAISRPKSTHKITSPIKRGIILTRPQKNGFRK